MFPRDKSKNIAMKRGRFSKRKNQTDEATRLDFDGIALFYYQAELIILFTSFSSSSFSIGFRINRFLSIALYSLFLNSS
jgi:hypothetical protein